MEGPPQEKSKIENPFARAYEDIEEVDVGRETIEAVDLRPEKENDPTPVLLVPGWGVTIPVYRPALEEIVRENRRAMSLNLPRRGGETTLDDMSREQYELVKDYPKEEIRRAVATIKVLEAKGVTRTDAIGHSEGGSDVMIAALLRPDLFRNLVLFGPAGLIGKDTPIRLLIGFIGQMRPKPTLDKIPIPEEEREWAKKRGYETLEYSAIQPTEVSTGIAKILGAETPSYIKQHPGRSIVETWGLSKIQMVDALRKLHEKGVSVIVMSAADDPVFPTTRMAETISASKKSKDEDITKILDGFAVVRGGHGELGDHPETHIVGAMALLRAAQNKREMQAARSGTSGGA